MKVNTSLYKNVIIVYKGISTKYTDAEASFENVNETFPHKVNVVTPQKTHVRKLSGVEKGLYRLNHSRELQFKFLQTLSEYKAICRRA